ncbi:MAG: hypothetical protein K9G64_00850 [Bacteroidia bacterium]|nr:hypothetical protein [Bacteroidia bacterium]
MFLLFVLGLCSISAFSQTAYNPKNASSKKAISAEFLYPEVEFKEIAVMTNVLKIKNNNGKTYTFNVTINLPGGWKTLNNPDREYTLKPNDSAYVPVRVITTDKKAKGGTKYSIAAYVNTNEGKQMAYARFIAGRPKVSNWQMQVLPRPRIYLLNGENTAQFQLNLSNEGDEPQDVLVGIQKLGKNFVVKDSSGKILKKNYIETTLKPYSDTTISYNIEVLNQIRNQKRIDTWGYNPDAAEREKRYGLFLRASEVRLEKNGAGQKNKKVDFIKLANNIDFVKLNNTTNTSTGSNSIPLTMFVNLNNVLGGQPIMMLNFIGNSAVGRYSSLNYQVQTGFSYYKLSNNFLYNQLVGNLTYTYKNAFIGLISGGGFNSIIGGLGFKKYHSINLSLSRQRLSDSQTLQSGVLGYSFNHKNLGINFVANAGFISNQLLNYGISLGTNYRITKRTLIGIAIGTNRNNLSNFNNENNFSSLTLSHSRNKFSGTFGINYSQNKLSLGLQEIISRSIGSNLNLAYTLRSNRRISLNSSYNTSTNNGNTVDLLPTDSTRNVLFNNFLIFTPKKILNKLSWSPMLFFNYNRFIRDTLVSGGMQFNLAGSDYDKEMFIGGNLRFAYNQLLNNKDLGIFFNSQLNVFGRYKVWNVIASYNYGPLGIGEISYNLKNNKVYSQALRLNLGHQYQFKNKHFVWENNLSYLYLNTLKRHSFGVRSEMFYFTNNGFRFSMNVNYNISSGLSFRYNYAGGNSANAQNFRVEETDKRTKSQSFNLGFTIKKDFSIPIPKRFRKNKFCDAKFVVFLDVNGNHVMDLGEVPVENVVLRMNDFEVITDDKGMASFINMAFAKYRLQVFPLIDMGSWFPNVNDSMDVCGPDLMYIPFSKGVQVSGGVELDRESFTGELFEKLDVSRFKIYMIDTLGKTYSAITDNKGNYNFYVPYAKYTLKFDEKALGSGFYLAENDISLDLSSGIESYYHNFLIIEKKRKVKRKIFGPDGKITYVEEDASSAKNGKDKDGKNANDKNNLAGGKDGKTKDGKGKDDLAQGKDGKDGNQTVTTQTKEQQLDSLINVLNRLIARAATRIDVRAIVKQEMQKLIDELNASFTINIEELPKGKNPTGMLMQLVRLNKVIETKLPNGSKVYTSGDYKNISEAEKFCRDYQTSGFKKAKVVKKIPQK